MLSFSQRSSRWKRTRYEVIAGTGIANFLGELGGLNWSDQLKWCRHDKGGE